MSKLIDKVAAAAEPVVQKNGCRLWDVEYVKEAGTWYLRVYIDRDGGVSIDQCEAVSRELDPILDEMDVIPGAYTFEVSSAGAERQLKRPSDFQQFMGSLVEVKLYRAKNGAKEFVGELTGYDDGRVSVSIGGNEITFEKSEVASVRLRISM